MDIDETVTDFTNMHPCHMKLANILEDFFYMYYMYLEILMKELCNNV